jgi:hypothetical protein
MRLEQRLKRIEDRARPMIDDRERKITAYVAEMKRLGYEITRKEAEQYYDDFINETNKLLHLPWPERQLQARSNLAIRRYRQATGASEDEAIAALRPLVPELLCTA